MAQGRREGGTLIALELGGREVSRATSTCKHCQRIVFLHDAFGMRLPADEQPPFCLQCFAVICDACGAKGSCTPFEAKISNYERDAERAARDGRMLEAVLR